MRLRFVLSLVVALCSVVAVIALFNGASLSVGYVMNSPPMAGMFGANARDLRRDTPAEAQARLRLNREILTELRWSIRVSQWSATLSLLGAIALVWKSRKDPRRQRLQFALLALIALAVFVLVQVT